ncbi:hypothetical protein [Nocardia fluminea]|nr:hypothetical protein [Nocardia fluminea]
MSIDGVHRQPEWDRDSDALALIASAKLRNAASSNNIDHAEDRTTTG